MQQEGAKLTQVCVHSTPDKILPLRKQEEKWKCKNAAKDKRLNVLISRELQKNGRRWSRENCTLWSKSNPDTWYWLNYNTPQTYLHHSVNRSFLYYKFQWLTLVDVQILVLFWWCFVVVVTRMFCLWVKIDTFVHNLIWTADTILIGGLYVMVMWQLFWNFV